MQPTEAKRHEAIYQRWCSQIMRETRDRESLAWVSARALHDREVQADPTLEGMIRGYIAEREVELRLMDDDRAAVQTADAAPAHPLQPAAPSPAQIQTAFDRLRHSFEDNVIHFDELGARSALSELALLRERYSDVIDAAEVERCREQLRQMEKRRDAFTEGVRAVARKAIRAARAGDHEAAAGALRRLSSIHAARPALLTDQQFARIRSEITQGGEDHEHREAARRLVQRERAVASQIKRLADVVHEFHLVSRRVAHDSDTYRRCERKYQAAVRSVRSHDTEWLAGLILELDAFLDELHDRSGRSETQVDRFLSSVRRAHKGLRREMSEISAEQKEIN